jgi:hypothetical protein
LLRFVSTGPIFRARARLTAAEGDGQAVEPLIDGGTSLSAFVGSCWCIIGALHLLEKKQGRGEQQPLNRATRRWTSIVNRPGRRRPREKKTIQSKSSPGLIIQWMPPIYRAQNGCGAEETVGPRPGRPPGFIHAPSARPASKAVMPPELNYTDGEREPVTCWTLTGSSIVALSSITHVLRSYLFGPRRLPKTNDRSGSINLACTISASAR